MKYEIEINCEYCGCGDIEEIEKWYKYKCKKCGRCFIIASPDIWFTKC